MIECFRVLLWYLSIQVALVGCKKPVLVTNEQFAENCMLKLESSDTSIDFICPIAVPKCETKLCLKQVAKEVCEKETPKMIDCLNKIAKTKCSLDEQMAFFSVAQKPNSESKLSSKVWSRCRKARDDARSDSFQSTTNILLFFAIVTVYFVCYY